MKLVSPEPPSLVLWLLRLLEPRLTPSQAESLIGDLYEEWQRRASAPFGAGLWFVGQVIGLVIHGRLHLFEQSPRRRKEPLVSQILSPFAVLRQDLPYALRRLRQSPGSSALVVATLAVGIGLNTLVFMFADAILLRPLPYGDPERLVVVETNSGGPGWYGSSEPELIDLERVEELESIGGWTGNSVVLVESGNSRRVRAALMTADLLPTLGVAPLFGRFFSVEEDQPGADRVVLVSHRFWQNELGGRDDVLGLDLDLGGRQAEIIGVMPPGFRYPSSRFDLWAPLRIDRSSPWERNNHYLSVVARLADSVTLDQAAARVETLAATSGAQYPEVYGEKGYRMRLLPQHEAVAGAARAPVLLVMGAVLLLLLLTCANLANLQLWRATLRQPELSVRQSLGASKPRLLAQLMTEAGILALLGGLSAVLIAVLGEGLLPRFLPAGLPRVDEIRLDHRVLSFVAIAAIATTVLFGLWPALRSIASNEGHSRMTRDRRSAHMRRVLVIVQVGLAVTLLFGCGLVLRSLQELGRVDPGFDPTGVFVFDASPPSSVYDTPEKGVAYYQAAEQALEALPDVRAAGAVWQVPISSGLSNWSIELEGRAVADIGEAPDAHPQHVTPGYQDAIGLRLLRGRFIEDSDTVDSEPVVVINQSMAAEHWPGEDALGRRFRVFSEDAPWMRVVGIVEDVRDSSLDQLGRDKWYVPHAQAYQTAYTSPLELSFVVRAATEDPMSAAPSVLAALAELDDRVALVDLMSFESILGESMALPRQIAVWLSLFSIVAIGLAALGLYGVLSYAVTSRRQELGIRIALGARPGRLLRIVVGEGLGLTTIGILCGLMLGLLLVRLASGVLFGVSGADSFAILMTVSVLALTALFASFVPAWRASHVDPTTSLRP